MIIQSKLKYISISLVIFLIPFLDFLKNNIDEIDIILGKSFYFLIFSLYSILLIISLIINYIFKKKDFYKVLLSVFMTFRFISSKGAGYDELQWRSITWLFPVSAIVDKASSMSPNFDIPQDKIKGFP